MVTGLSSIVAAVSVEVVHTFVATLKSSIATAGHIEVAVVARLASTAAWVEHAC